MRSLMLLLSVADCDFLTDPSKEKERGVPRLFLFLRVSWVGCLTAELDDVATGAALVVEHAGRLRVLDAVPGAGRVHLDGDVLDAGVVGELQLGQVRPQVQSLVLSAA